jgi:hypothetical protein
VALRFVVEKIYPEGVDPEEGEATLLASTTESSRPSARNEEK